MSRFGRRAVVFLVTLTVWGLGSPPVFGTGQQERAFTVVVQNRQVAPDKRVVRVQQGDTVILRLISDETVTLHLHGYEREQVVTAGVPAELTFQATATGRFPITAHGFGAQTYERGETPLAYVEVLPR
jgi:hypothetical protein